MKRMICDIERRRLLCRLSERSRPSQKQRKRRSLANNCSDPARQLEQIIGRRIADAARPNGASGPSDIDGTAARVAESDSGEEGINSLRSVVIRCGNWKKQHTGWTCSWTERS